MRGHTTTRSSIAELPWSRTRTCAEDAQPQGVAAAREYGAPAGMNFVHSARVSVRAARLQIAFSSCALAVVPTLPFGFFDGRDQGGRPPSRRAGSSASQSVL